MGAQQFIDGFSIDDREQIIISAITDTSGGVLIGLTSSSLILSGGIAIAATAGITIHKIGDYNMWKMASEQIQCIQTDRVQVTLIVWDTGDTQYFISELR